MSKKNKTALIPKLRFPVYTSLENWKIEKLGNVTYTVSKKNTNRVMYPIYSINNKEGFLPQADQFEGVDSNSRGYDISLYKIIGKKTFAYNPARINVGSIGYSGDLYDIIISSLYVCFKTNDEIEDKFFQYFITTSYFNKQVNNNTEGGIRNYLFYENFSRILIAFPDINEQQKIADCLSSLDDLITAENKKLEALKAHKKGLLQKLFPAEGETVPEWRFSEFNNTYSWKLNTIRNSCETFSGGTPDTSKGEYYNGNIPFIRSGEIDNTKTELFISIEGLNNSSAKMVKSGDVLVAMYGANSGDVAISKINGAINQAILCLRHETNNLFIYQYLNHKKNWIITSFLQGGQGNLSGEIIKSIKLFFPSSKEQQLIANFFSSLDEVISLQIMKIKSLKTHKKGLMQGLFPSINEVYE